MFDNQRLKDDVIVFQNQCEVQSKMGKVVKVTFCRVPC